MVTSSIGSSEQQRTAANSSEQQRTAANSSEQQRTAKDYNENLLDVKEAAEFLRVKTETLATWLCRNKYPQLKSIKIGRYRRFLKQDLIKFIKSLSRTNAEWRKGKP